MIEARMRVDKKKFGKFIASRREIVQGIETQELLAKRLNISVGYMGKLESGGGLPSFDLFIDLADSLQMTPGDLMMVMAERQDGNKHYQEMNTWLFDRISEVLSDYVNLITPNGLPKSDTELGEDQRAAEGLARAEQRQMKNYPKKPPQETDIPETQESN